LPRPRNILGGDCGRDATENFIQGRPDFEEAVERLVAFAQVGVDVVYVLYPSTWAGFGRS
jgi:2-methylisocitrate lyase-like PEP mutase family enzyme